MDKNQKILIVIIAFLVVIFAVVGFLAYKNEKNKPVDKINKFKEEYELLNGVVNDDGYTYPTVDIDSKNAIVYSNDEEIFKILKNGSGIIYFGLPTNPYSRNVVKPLLSAADSTDTKKIYYLNIKDFRDELSINDNGEIITEKEGSNNYKNIIGLLDTILSEYYIADSAGNVVDTNEKRLEIPLVVAVSKGEIIDYHYLTVNSNIENPYNELNKDEQEELYSYYISMMTKLNESACDEGVTKGC